MAGIKTEQNYRKTSHWHKIKVKAAEIFPTQKIYFTLNYLYTVENNKVESELSQKYHLAILKTL